MSADNSAIVQAISDVLLRNGFTDVGPTSLAVSRALAALPSGADVQSSVAAAVERGLVVRGRTSRKKVAAIILAQLPKLSVVADEMPSNVRACIFVATSLEYAEVMELLTSSSEALDDNNNWVCVGATPGGNVVTLVMTGQGNVASGAVATSLLVKFRPMFCAFSGIAGGLQNQEPGTVVIASQIHDYDSAEDGDARGSRAKSIMVPHSVVQISAALVRSGVPGVPVVRVQPIASGEKLITSSESESSKWVDVVASDAAVVEMEGLGMMRAASNLGIPGTVVRAVSDHKDDKTTTSDASNQPIAARAAARVSVALVDKFIKETAR